MTDQREHYPDLSSNDRRVLDALIDNGFDIEALEPLSEADRQRARRVTTLFGLMNDYPVEDSEPVLIDATMARIDKHDRELGACLRFDQHQEEQFTGRRRIPLPNLISIAAMILIAVSVMWPILGNIRRESIRARQINNLMLVQSAVENYANDYNGKWPTARAGLTDGVRSLSDVINLTPVVADGYARIADPETEQPLVSPDQSAQWTQSNLVLFMNDQHPIARALRERKPVFSPVTIRFEPSDIRRNIFSENGGIMLLDAPQVGQDVTYWRFRDFMWLAEDITPPAE